jgi:hypothetical protein
MGKVQVRESHIPAAVEKAAGNEDGARWEKLVTAFATYCGATVLDKQVSIRQMLDATFDRPHATSQEYRNLVVLRAHNRLSDRSRQVCDVYDATLGAQRSRLQQRVPMFDELATRLDQDPNYRRRQEERSRNPDLDAIYLRRVQVLEVAHVVEMSLGLPLPHPNEYTYLNGLTPTES